MRAADHVTPLADQGVEPAAGQVGGRDQPVVPAADDYRIPCNSHEAYFTLSRSRETDKAP